MNRRQMNIGGMVITILLILGVVILRNKRLSGTTEIVPGGQVSELVYCSSSDIKPCIVSFSLDADNNMLVNLLLPDLSFPGFYLQITRGDVNVRYECQRVVAVPNNAFCIGEKLPPGEILHLMLISIKDDALLAEGSLSIIGLAFPTIAAVTLMPSMTPTSEPTATIESTSMPTPIQSPIRTPTPPSYP